MMYSLVGDIGGTNARFAIVKSGSLTIFAFKQFLCSDFKNLTELVRFYLANLECAHPRQACLAIAAPITGNEIQFTNLDWHIKLNELQTALNVEKLHVLNDFLAVAWALPYLERNDFRVVGPSNLTLNPSKPKIVMGPGTGVGVAALIPTERTSHHVAVDTQGGHVAFAPTNDTEIAILGGFRKRYRRVSMEHVLSGRGLHDLFTIMQDLGLIGGDPATSTMEISRRLLDGDLNARECVDQFCAILGSFAGDLALTYGAHGGVYIGGGVVLHFLEFFIQSSFRQRFEHKGVMKDYIAPIPTNIITSKAPALTGAAAYLNQLSNE